MNIHPLPASGMEIDLSVAGSAAAELQTTELTGMTTPKSFVGTKKQIAVQTELAVQQLSLQAIQRGEGVEQLVLTDLLARVASLQELTVLTQATYGMQTLATGVTYTDTDPTGIELYPKLLEAASGIEEALAGPIADYAVMASRRWNWLSGELADVWPFVNSNGIPQVAAGVNANQPYGGVRGVLPNGMRVVVSENVPKTVSGSQDVIFVMASRESHLWEENVQYIRCEQPLAAQLGVQLVVYRFFAYSLADRYEGSQAMISGSGLVNPYAA